MTRSRSVIAWSRRCPYALFGPCVPTTSPHLGENRLQPATYHPLHVDRRIPPTPTSNSPPPSPRSAGCGRPPPRGTAERRYADGLPQGTDRAFLVRVVAEVPGVEHFLRELVAAAPDDVLALTDARYRRDQIGWEIRSSALSTSAGNSSGSCTSTCGRPSNCHPGHRPRPVRRRGRAARLTTAMGLQLGQNEARRRIDRLAAYHPHHSTGQARLLQQLCPKWERELQAAHGFARECLLNSPKGRSVVVWWRRRT